MPDSPQPSLNIHPLLLDRNFIYYQFIDFGIEMKKYSEFDMVINTTKLQLNQLGSFVHIIVKIENLELNSRASNTSNKRLVSRQAMFLTLAREILDCCIDVTAILCDIVKEDILKNE